MYQKHPPVFNFTKKKADFDLITTGDRFFKLFFDDIRNAKSNVDISFFIVKNDDISKQFYTLLKQKTTEGVTVRFMVDRIGSFRLKKDIINDLKTNGVEFIYSDKPSFPFLFYKLNRRNHRKITVIDHEVAYIGGFNIGKEYIGADPKLGDPWRDYHIRMTGAVIPTIQQVFDYDYTSATLGNPISVDYITDKGADQETSHQTKSLDIIVSESGQLEDKFVSWINNATSEILIGTPYFIPSKRMFNALLTALYKGIDVKVIVPEKADHPLVKPAGFPYYRELTRAGGDVFLFNQGFYHAKVIIIDETFCDLGTANFDMRSVFLNKEINVIMDSYEDINSVRSAFLKDINNSRPITEQWMQQQSVKVKLEGLVARLVRPLL
nr:cardiolipin synthase [Aquibacillus saliphilus]